MTDRHLRLVDRALAGKKDALRELVAELTPVIQARAARALLRAPGARAGRSIRQELEDLTQEVFVALFADDGRALRAWAPDRGLSLKNFVGLLAQRQVSSILRSGKRSPWTEDPVALGVLEAELGSVLPERQVESRELLERLLERMREVLSPRGLLLFQRLCVDEESVESVTESFHMSAAAIYAWRSRLRKQVAQLVIELQNEQPMSESD